MLKQVRLANIRSYEQGSFDFGPLTVLVGSNGSGKTNILEAIYLASTTTSWRTKSDAELIKWEADAGRLEVDDVAVALSRHPYRKYFWIDGVKRSAKEVVGHLKTVLFQPDDLSLVLGSPAYRRHFLNVVLAQSDRAYGQELITYRQVLLQRNRLLKQLQDGRAQEAELHFWDAELVRLADTIWAARERFVTLANEQLPTYYRSISDDAVTVAIQHHTHPLQREQLAEEIAAWHGREIAAGQTLRGPHRDDLVLSMDAIPARERASRGEVRSLTIALKLVELAFLQKSPSDAVSDVVLLLDDVMSELDANRRQRLLTAVDGVQTVLSTTDLSHLPPSLAATAQIISL